MAYTPILATLAYTLSSDHRQVLMIHRNARPDDQAYGKYNGLGGKLEPHEDVLSSLRREMLEEANLQIEEVALRGTVSWPGFGKQGEDWLGFVFLITRWSGDLFSSNHEGTLEWVPVEKLLSLELNLWSGDRYFLPLVFDQEVQPFHGIMPYRNGEPVSWSYTRL